MSEPHDKKLDRLRWQCRRGLLELDCIFEDYLEQRYLQAEETERALFCELLENQDPDLQAWLLFGEQAPRRFEALIRKLRGEG